MRFHRERVGGVLRRPSVEDHVIGRQREELLPVDRHRGRVDLVPRRAGVELALHQHVFARRGAGADRVDDDRAVHPARNVECHGGGAAVIHERPCHVRHELVLQRVIRVHVDIHPAGRDLGRMEVHRVRDRRLVHHGEVHRVTDRYPEHRPRHLPVEGPGVEGDAVGEDDPGVPHLEPDLVAMRRRAGRGHGIDRRRSGSGPDRRLAVGDVGGGVCGRLVGRSGRRRGGCLRWTASSEACAERERKEEHRPRYSAHGRCARVEGIERKDPCSSAWLR